ncbi:uncharacterized protein LOC134815498 [Bolinopsis microptera]|uniref:uncharacterized protein LOC134815498 n=1 Tax=Bolinopsis microptera TaxID=2820187 RepID=UPI00307AB22B
MDGSYSSFFTKGWYNTCIKAQIDNVALTIIFSNMEELRKSNQELLKKLKIGQARAWDILNDSSNVQNRQTANGTSKAQDFQPPYAFSTPTKTYIEFLDKAGNKRYDQIASTNGNCSTNQLIPLSDIMNDSSSSNYGRPHKTPLKDKTIVGSDDSPIHSPHCTENHRERLHQKLNASYSKLAADLRQIAPSYGADLAYDLSVNSGISNKPDSYYNELKKFRMANSDLCSVKLPDHLNITQNTLIVEDKENSDKVEELNHQCIQTYSVSQGYRAVDSHSGGQCPLCIGDDDTKHKGLIRVNIPHNELVDYKVYPREIDDSVSLSSHCSTGWEHASTQYKSFRQ